MTFVNVLASLIADVVFPCDHETLVFSARFVRVGQHISVCANQRAAENHGALCNVPVIPYLTRQVVRYRGTSTHPSSPQNGDTDAPQSFG